MSLPDKLAGVFAAVLTPLTADLRPDLGRFVDHCKRLLRSGCDGLAPLGTTGEANSIALIDRIALIEAASRVGLPLQQMIVGTGTSALHDTVALSRTALEAGAGGILVLPPYYYKSPSEDGLFAAYAALLERIGDLAPRVYMYHFPQMSAVPITLTLVTRLREAYPGLIVGMKDSSGDFANTSAFIDAFDDFAVFSSSEDLLLANIAKGGAGCISATTNVTATLAQAAVAAYRSSGGGEAEQELAASVRRVILRFPGIPALKAIVAARRGDPAWLNILPPHVALPAADTAALFAALSEFDEFSALRAQAAE